MGKYWFAILAILCVLTIIVQPFTPYTATGAFVALLCGGFIATVLKICSWTTGRQERRRLIDDANRQHAAMMRGQDRFGTYGRFEPIAPWTWVS